MRQRKADRWDKLVEKERWSIAKDGYLFRCDQVAQLLRRQHWAVLRIIQRAQSDYIDSDYRQVCQEILDLLKRRAR